MVANWVVSRAVLMAVSRVDSKVALLVDRLAALLVDLLAALLVVQWVHDTRSNLLHCYYHFDKPHS